MDHDSAAATPAVDGAQPLAESESASPWLNHLPATGARNRGKKKLTIKISQPKTRERRSWRQVRAEAKDDDDEDDDYDAPLSADIEVVHTQPSPPLHSILKQRTVSESSEDFTPQLELDGPRFPLPPSPEDEEEDLSPGGEEGKRRSVSFSKHIDRATFKSSASVSSMKTALKSKRKRQRKWEERRDKASSRRRHNSAGSEGSVDDVTLHSDSHSHSEEEHAQEEGVDDAGGEGVFDHDVRTMGESPPHSSVDKLDDDNLQFSVEGLNADESLGASAVASEHLDSFEGASGCFGEAGAHAGKGEIKGSSSRDTGDPGQQTCTDDDVDDDDPTITDGSCIEILPQDDSVPVIRDEVGEGLVDTNKYSLAEKPHDGDDGGPNVFSEEGVVEGKDQKLAQGTSCNEQ